MYEAEKSPPPVTGRDLALILRRRAKLALCTFLLVVAATAGLTSLMKPVYQARARVRVTSPAQGGLPSTLMDLLSARSGTPLDSHIEVLRSHNVLSEVISKGKLATTPDELRSRIRLEPSTGEKILDIAVRARSAEEARDTADLLARMAVEVARADQEKAATDTTARLRREQRKAEKEKDEAAERVNAFMRAVGNVSPADLYERRAALVTETRAAIEKNEKDLEVERKRREELAATLRTLKPDVVSSYSLDKNPVLDSFRTRLADLKVKLETTLQDFTPASDDVQVIKNEIAAVEGEYRQALRSAYNKGSQGVTRNPDYVKTVSDIIDSGTKIATLQADIRATGALKDRLEAEQRVLAARKSRFEDLMRRRETAIQKYEQLSKGVTSVEIQQSTAMPTMRLLDSARLPDFPVSPKPLLNALMALFLGALLAVVMALVAEYLASAGQEDETVGLPQVAGVPLLGAVPIALPALGAGGLPVPVRASARAEDALREVGYCLAHLRHGRKDPVPVVLLVGARSDDTTAAVAAQLAATLVRDGLRVTLVDADRARPRLNRVFGAPDAPGVADVLAGRARANDILHIGADGCLRFLAAGSPDDPIPWAEHGLRALFKDLSGDTDLVLVSGPAVFGVPAVAPLQRAADGLVLVAPPDIPAAESVARARRLLTNGYRPHILGVVVGEAAEGAAARPDAPTREDA